MASSKAKYLSQFIKEKKWNQTKQQQKTEPNKNKKNLRETTYWA